MSIVGIIVDGQGDYVAFSARYANRVKVLKTTGPRGHTVSEVQVINGAKKQIQMLKAWGCSPIAIITDFEMRHGRASEFCERAKKYAESIGLASDLLFFAPDRMLENWILADVVSLGERKTYLKKLKKQKNYESSDGKSELKKIFAPGYTYNEVKHSAELFPLVRADQAEIYSASFAHFKRGLGLD